MEEKEYKVFTVAIEKKDIKSAESTIALIQKFVCAERKVPYQLFNKLLDILTTETSLESKYYSERANSIALLANQYFSSYKDYDFNGLTKNQIRQFPEPNFDGMTQSDYDKLLKPIKKEYVPLCLEGI